MRGARVLLWSVLRSYRFAIVALCVRSQSEWRTPLTLRFECPGVQPHLLGDSRILSDVVTWELRLV